MAKLKLKASSLIEVVVSSVIMLIAFAISMDTLVRLSTAKNNAEETVQMEMDIRTCLKKENTDAETCVYDWGEIDITEEYIGNGLFHVKYSVKTKRQKKTDFEKILFRKDKL